MSSLEPNPSPMAIRPRVLVIEDEFLIAAQVQEILEECGCEVVGPYGLFDEALTASRSVAADAAIVDLILHDRLAYPIADILEARRIPFGFATGRETAATESAWEQKPFLGKPFTPQEVRDLIGRLLPAPKEAAPTC